MTDTEQGYTILGGNGDLLGIVQDIEICQYYQIVHAQTRIPHMECDV